MILNLQIVSLLYEEILEYGGPLSLPLVPNACPAMGAATRFLSIEQIELNPKYETKPYLIKKL